MSFLLTSREFRSRIGRFFFQGIKTRNFELTFFEVFRHVFFWILKFQVADMIKITNRKSVILYAFCYSFYIGNREESNTLKVVDCDNLRIVKYFSQMVLYVTHYIFIYRHNVCQIAASQYISVDKAYVFIFSRLAAGDRSIEYENSSSRFCTQQRLAGQLA